MELRIKELGDLNKHGVYLIKNLVNNKVYIGSTTKSFRVRYTSHKSKLKSNKHGTPHLQASWNKHGGHNFEFSILEICDSDNIDIILQKEKEYIQLYNACERDFGFNNNSNPSKSCALIPEIKKKISETLKSEYKKGNIPISKSCFKKGHITWNAGIKYTDTSFMKKPKTITESLKQAWINTSIRGRSRSKAVEVYDNNQVLLYTAKSIIDLVEWSNSDNNFLPINSRFGKELLYGKVNAACRTGKPYKNLFFKYIKESL